MDLALGDAVDAQPIVLPRIRYRGQPLIGEDFSVLAYPPETIFAEKLQIAIKRSSVNTRMKDYYDLVKLAQRAGLDKQPLKRAIKKTFAHRNTPFGPLNFNADQLEQLQTYWVAFVRKSRLTDAPARIHEAIQIINQTLREIV